MSAVESGKILKDLEERVSKLEKAVFNAKSLAIEPSMKKLSPDHPGLNGGILLLIETGSFSTPKSVEEVHDELATKGYYYSTDSVNKALRIDFLTRKKLLSRVRLDGIWKYAIRK